MNIRELLPLYGLGALDESEAAAVENAAGSDPDIARELDSYLDLVPAVTPGADVASRLMASVGGGRFERFTDRVAKMLDVTIDGARELLGLIERPASWVHPIPGIHLIHFNGGPAYAAADCGFVRIEPGCTFPWHMHRGEEVSVILDGLMIDRDGTTYTTGAEVRFAEGTQHDLTAGPDGVVYIARAMNGIEVLGHPR